MDQPQSVTPKRSSLPTGKWLPLSEVLAALAAGDELWPPSTKSVRKTLEGGSNG